MLVEMLENADPTSWRAIRKSRNFIGNRKSIFKPDQVLAHLESIDIRKMKVSLQHDKTKHIIMAGNDLLSKYTVSVCVPPFARKTIRISSE